MQPSSSFAPLYWVFHKFITQTSRALSLNKHKNCKPLLVFSSFSRTCYTYTKADAYRMFIYVYIFVFILSTVTRLRVFQYLIPCFLFRDSCACLYHKSTTGGINNKIYNNTCNIERNRIHTRLIIQSIGPFTKNNPNVINKNKNLSVNVLIV